MTRVSNEEAQAQLEQGVPFLDVRTEQEFADGHVPGARNVPYMMAGPGGMSPNPEFVQVVEALFEKNRPLLVGCRSGARSARATAELDARGFVSLSDVTAGFAGAQDAFGRPLPGWSQEERPIETSGDPALEYVALRKRAGLD